MQKNTSVPVRLDRQPDRPQFRHSQHALNRRIQQKRLNSENEHNGNNNNRSEPQLWQQFNHPVRTFYINQQEFDQLYQFRPARAFSWRRLRALPPRLENWTRAPAACFVHFLRSFLPILGWLPDYKWRECLPGDLMAGITVGVVHVPQSIAYAILSGLDPVHGLYTSFFAVMLYMLFGTSRHVSVGSFAIISLMTSLSCRDINSQLERAAIEAELEQYGHHRRLLVRANGTISELPLNPARMVPEVEYSELVQMITLTAGLIQIAMAVLRVEFLASYLSDQLVNGFCTGAAFHVVGVQLGRLVELDLGRIGGPGYLYKTLRNLILRFPFANPLALGLSLASFAFLYLGKDLLGPRLRRFLPVVLPMELILVIFTTAASHAADFATHHNISVVNDVPMGLPTARLPRLDLFPYVFGDALEIAFVSVALHLSMCKVFNRRMDTVTDNNLELYAMGLIGSFSSFFITFPVSTALGRSMLNVECGAKTQLSSLFSALLLLVVILFLGPLLSALPMCILAVIIIFSMKSAFQKMPHEFVHLWRVSKIDFLIWLVTLVATVVLNVMQGLAVAVTFALLTTVFRIQWPRWHLLSNLSGTENYRDSGRYSRITPLGHGIRIFRFDAPLLFTNVEHFAKSARKAITMPLPPQRSATLTLTPNVAECPLLAKNDKHTKHTHNANEEVKSLIVDCTGFTFVDYTSINALSDLYHQLNDVGVNVLFAGAKAPVRDMLDVCEFHNSVPKDQFYPNIHDAVLAASHKKKWQRHKRSFVGLSLKRNATASPALAAQCSAEDCNSLCVGQNELFKWSFRHTMSDLNTDGEDDSDADAEMGEHDADEECDEEKNEDPQDTPDEKEPEVEQEQQTTTTMVALTDEWTLGEELDATSATTPEGA